MMLINEIDSNITSNVVLITKLKGNHRLSKNWPMIRAFS